MTRQPDSPEPLSAEEEAAFRRDHAHHPEVGQDAILGDCGTCRLLATLDAARSEVQSDLRAALVRAWKHIQHIEHWRTGEEFADALLSDEGVDAARSAIPAAEGLDVERLARAMESFYGKRRGAFNVTAPAIAAEYVRLRDKEPTDAR